jgi:ATP-dependent Clp protease protease subunit
MNNDFRKYALSQGVNGNTLDDYTKKTNGIISPMILEERNLNVATMDIFSRLMFDRIIVLGTAVSSDVANIVTSQLMYLNSVDSDADIKLFINTPGGSVIDGLAIYDIMNWVEPDVATYAMGMAASMGSILISSGAKGKRYALPNSKIMIHQVSSGIGYINTADLKIEFDEMKKDQNILYNILAENTGKSLKQIEKDADRDHWFTSKEALEYGLIDEIIFKKSKN